MIRSPQVRLFDDELVLDCFAGGGGASTGIEMAIGRSPDIAINHDREALALHEANHPRTRHIRSNIRKVSFRRECQGRKVGLAWFSPDCTYHSKARGGRPYRPRDRARRIRGLIWEAARCAKEVRPRVIAIENVEELRDWCPLTQDGRPDPTKRGQSFDRFNARMRNLGYVGEWREERASTKGAPTIRKRLFGVFRCDGQPITWEAPTHGPGTAQPYRTAAECIDFNEPVPSIFMTPAEAKAWGKAHGRPSPKRPLASATLRRIARGVDRFVINNPKPFIVRYNGARDDGSGEFRGQSEGPISTLDTSNRFGVVTPFIAPITHTGGDRVHAVDEPLRTVTTASRGELALTAPVLVGVGGRNGQSPETSVGQPFHTITAKGDTAIVAPTLAPFITKYRDGSSGSAIDEPMPTITANTYHKRPGGNPPLAIATAFLAKHNGGHEATGQTLDRPADTLVARDNKALVASLMVKLRGGLLDHVNTSQDLREPAPTLTAGGTHVAEIRTVLVPAAFVAQYPRARLVAAFLLKYYGSKKDGSPLDRPIGTVVTKDRYAIVVVTIDGEDLAIVDIGMRMLLPRELFLCQGFPLAYVIDIMLRVRKTIHGRITWKLKPITKSTQVRLCGNSVSPPHAASIVRANFAPKFSLERTA